MSEGGEPGPVQDQPAPVVGEHGDTGTESEMLPVLSVAPGIKTIFSDFYS